tara:strand:- start:1434 stop:2000 length:567 start_codon:yes stop_codon:yes gene_type:complete
MVTRLSDYIKTYDDKLDSDFCENVINTFHESDSIYVDREQRPTFRELNISERYLNKDPKWMSIQARLSDILTVSAKSYINYLDVGADFPAQYGFEQFRMKMYDNNGKDQFKDHVDVGDHASAKRFLVMFLYLNDVKEGGETNFPNLNVAIKPKCGRILLFPANWQYRHSGLPPVSSQKYIVGSYLHYT